MFAILRSAVGWSGPLSKRQRARLNVSVKRLREGGVSHQEVEDYIAWRKGRVPTVYPEQIVNSLLGRYEFRVFKVQG